MSIITRIQNRFLKIKRYQFSYCFNYIRFTLKRFGIYSKKQGNYDYTIITPCKDVEHFIDRYVKSIIKQSLSFKKNIQIIFIYDLSSDNTLIKINSWIKKYPYNISCIHNKTNLKSHARNIALTNIKSRWVTFIDADDFICRDYFLIVDTILGKNNDICMVGTNIIFCEKNNLYKDTHAFNYKFKRKKVNIIEVDNISNNVQMSASSAFFKTSIILDNNLYFNEIGIGFESALFIASYLAICKNKKVAYLAHAYYFCRKNSPFINKIFRNFDNIDWFTYRIKNIYFDILLKKGSFDSEYIEKIVFFDLYFYINHIVQYHDYLPFMNNGEKKEFILMMRKCFDMISDKTILNYNIININQFFKIGIFNLLKQKSINAKKRIYINRFDPKKSEILIKYYTDSEQLEEFYINDIEVIPTSIKTVQHKFLDEVFAFERVIWIPVDVSKISILTCRINNKPVKLDYKAKSYDKITIDDVCKSLEPLEGPWIFMDRDIQADDNAEHLYRWILKNHPEQEAYFVLRRNSKDWDRLNQEGFHLLAYGDIKHEYMLKKCSKIISSQLSDFVRDYFHDGSTDDKQIIFLQHGVVHNDLSCWFNRIKKIDLMTTTTHDEYKALDSDYSSYTISHKNICLTGLARHDKLLENNREDSKRILIMPTWRSYLVGRIIDGHIREINPDFMNDEYAVRWKSFLRCDRLRQLSEEYGYDVIFFPHVNIHPYLDQFELPSYINTIRNHEGSIQELFWNSTFMITDYSSVAFEMAFLHKPVIYYQFDEDVFFSGKHGYSHGYFDFRKNGFGPVVTDEENLCNAIKIVLDNDGKPESPYINRMEQTFKLRDGNNCRRIYEQIIQMDKPYPKGWINLDVLQGYIVSAIRRNQWELAGSRVMLLKSKNDAEEFNRAFEYLKIERLISEGKITEASERLDNLTDDATATPRWTALFNEIRYRVLAFQEKWHEAFEFLNYSNNINDYKWRTVLCAKNAGIEASKILGTEWDPKQAEFVENIISNKKFDIHNYDDFILTESRQSITLCILVLKYLYSIKDINTEKQYRDIIKNKYEKNIIWRMLTAERWFTLGGLEGYKESVHVLNVAFPIFDDMPKSCKFIYNKAVCELEKFNNTIIQAGKFLL